MSNDESLTPRRRSLIPGASNEAPVPHDVHHGPQASEPSNADDQATEVYPSFVVEEPAPVQRAYRAPVQALPWFRRTWVLVTAAGVILLGAAIGITLALSGGPDQVAAPTASPSPTEESPSPSATVVSAPQTLLDDGIADDEYPPAAPRAGKGYPDALEMKDWVWDRVGPAWTLVSVSNYDPSSRATGPTVIYLASPEGKLFDLVHVERQGTVIQVVSWLTAERKARIQLTPLSYDESGKGGALVDLQTGAIENMVFSMKSGQSAIETFGAASASGAELWSGSDANYGERRFERWTAADGWNRVLTETDISPWTWIASHDGSFVAAELYSTGDSGFASARSGPPGEPVFVVYDVASGSSKLVRPSYGSVAEGWCNLTGVTDKGAPVVLCWRPGSEQSRWASAADKTPLAPLSQEDLRGLQMPGSLYEVTRADLSGQGITLVSAASDSQVYEVDVDSGGSSVPVLKAGTDVPYGGLSQLYAMRVAEGVTLLRSNEACAIIDTENAHGAMLAATTSGAIGCVGYGMGNGSPPSSLFGGE